MIYNTSTHFKNQLMYQELGGFMVLIRSDKLPVTHAGIVFKKRVLDRHKITITDAAIQLHVTRKEISDFVNGHSHVTINLAKKLETGTGISSGFWLNIQKNYDITCLTRGRIILNPFINNT